MLQIALFCFLILSFQTLQAKPFSPPKERYAPYPTAYKHHVENKTGDQPLITPFTYRSIADHILDQSIEEFDPDSVKRGDILYVNVWYLDWFEDVIHPKIKHPYILICCDVGAMVPDFGERKKLLYDPKLAVWFGKNMAFSFHPKLIQIPMGHNDLQWTPFNEHGYDQFLTNYIKEGSFEKKHLLYMNHYPRPFGDRDKIVKLFEDAPYCFTHQHSSRPYSTISRIEYYRDLAASEFVISPIGYEIDCVRNWEAFSLHCVPIVEHTFLDHVYDDLPVVFVDNFEEVNQSFLEQKRLELQSMQFNYDKTLFDYWFRLIKDMQAKVRRAPYQFSRLEASLFEKQDLQDLKSILTEKPCDTANGRYDLLCMGSLMTLRPFQLGKELTSLNKIYLFDLWADASEDVYRFRNQVNFPKDIDVSTCNTYDAYNKIAEGAKNDIRIFLDLTYFRSSINLDYDKHPRHNLLTDLELIYEQMQPGMLLCGNMRTDPYVSKVLQKFAEERRIDITPHGNFWYIISSGVN